MKLKDFVKITALQKIKFQPWDHVLEKQENYDDVLNIETSANEVGGGIYRMYNQQGEIVYVGKSNNIHRRLLQHIGRRTNTSYFIDDVAKIEYYVENNLIFQSMLEGIFIAYHTPMYNNEVQEEAEKEMGETL